MEASRKELKSKYKSAGTLAGVFQIRNLVNGKVFLGIAQNLPGILNSNRFQLTSGSHPNARLQAEWKQYGPNAFAFETLDELAPCEDGRVNIRTELSELENLWLEKLKPYGERGYHKSPKLDEGTMTAEPGVVADRSRSLEGYRSMGRSEGKVQGARKRRQLNATSK